MSEQNTGVTAQKLIFACSGAADVGQIADLAARDIAKKGMGQLLCLAAVGSTYRIVCSKGPEGGDYNCR